MENFDKIKELFNTEINTQLAEHGGSAAPLSINGDTLYIQMFGACLGCLQADETVTDYIQKRVHSEFPEIKYVIRKDPVADEMFAFAKTLMGKRQKDD